MNLNRYSIYILILIIICMPLYNYINLSVENRVPFSPDENNVLFIANQIIEHNSYFWSSSLNEKYGVDFFIPRRVTKISTNIYSAFHSIGFTFLLAIVGSMNLINVIISITAVFGILAIYLLVSELYDAKIGILSTSLFSIFPTYLYYSNAYFDIIPAFAFFIFSMFYLFRFLKIDSKRYLILSLIFYSFSIFLRPHFALFLVAYIFILFLSPERITFRNIKLILIISIIFFSPLLLLNNHVYGGYFTIGQSLAINATTSTIVANFPVNFSVIESSLRTFIIEYLTIIGLIILGLLGYLYEYIHRHYENRRHMFLIFWMIISLELILFFGSRGGTYAFNILSPGSSMAKYYLPIYLVFCIYTSIFISKFFTKKKSVLIVVLLILNIFSFSFNMNIPDTLPVLSKTNNEYGSANNEINELPSNSVVFTKRWDKFIFPDREVAIVFTEKDVAEDPDLAKVFPIVDFDHDIIPVIDKLIDDKIHVYIAGDASDLVERLKQLDYEINQTAQKNILILEAKKSVLSPKI